MFTYGSQSRTTTASCARCKSIPLDLFLREESVVDKSYTHELQPSLQALLESAEAGCRACIFFLEQVQHAVGYNEPRLQDRVVMSRSTDLNDNLSISCADSITKLSFMVWSGSKPEKWFAPSGYLPLEANSDVHVELFRNIIESCERNHPLCKAAAKVKKYPKRLVDVGASLEDVSVRIVAGKTARQGPTHPRYLSLSHCWGDVPQDAPWKLTKSRLEPYSTALSLSVLPPTFYEAIMMTRRLGERYIWIDSLCIIQDSAEDWTIESQNIGLCTLSAASDNASGGLVLPRRRLLDEVELRLNWNGTTDEKQVVFFTGSSREAKIDETPVYKRAWCLQERELSTRLIQFTSQQFNWTCVTTSVTEKELYRGSHDIAEASSYIEIRRRPGIAGTLAPPPKLRELARHHIPFLSGPAHWNPSFGNIGRGHYNHWYRTVETYTRAGITFPGDRHVAFDGLAKKYHSRLPTTYVVGLWEGDLARGLIWMVKPEMRVKSPPDSRIAPSWSWIHLNAPVTLEYCMNAWFGHSTFPPPPKLKILPGQRTDQVHNGGRFPELVVTGCLYEVHSDDPGDSNGPVALRCWLNCSGELYFDTHEDAQTCRKVYCFPIMPRWHEYTNLLYGLALVPSGRRTTSASIPEYRRVGFIDGVHDRIFTGVKPVVFKLV